MEKLLVLLLFFENITIIGALILFYYRKKKIYWQSIKKYSFSIQPNAKFVTTKTEKVFTKQKSFIELPELGAYQMRLYHLTKHKHTNTTSLIFVTKGEAHVAIGSKKITVRPGSFVYVPANVVHEWQVIKPHSYVEYLEIATPSFAFTSFQDTVWQE